MVFESVVCPVASTPSVSTLDNEAKWLRIFESCILIFSVSSLDSFIYASLAMCSTSFLVRGSMLVTIFIFTTAANERHQFIAFSIGAKLTAGAFRQNECSSGQIHDVSMKRPLRDVVLFDTYK